MMLNFLLFDVNDNMLGYAASICSYSSPGANDILYAWFSTSWKFSYVEGPVISPEKYSKIHLLDFLSGCRMALESLKIVNFLGVGASFPTVCLFEDKLFWLKITRKYSLQTFFPVEIWRYSHPKLSRGWVWFSTV